MSSTQTMPSVIPMARPMRMRIEETSPRPLVCFSVWATSEPDRSIFPRTMKASSVAADMMPKPPTCVSSTMTACPKVVQ